MLHEVFPAIRSTFVLAAFTGIAFPIVITAICQLTFPRQADGSLIQQDKKIIGSSILGQTFTRSEYFHPRPSAAGSGYAGEASSGTNFGPTSKKLILGDQTFLGVQQLADSYRKENNLPANKLVPVDAVTRSASGLDPDITPANAHYQLERVAKARNLSSQTVAELIKRHTSNREFGVLGEPKVNVLQLNLSLDAIPSMNK